MLGAALLIAATMMAFSCADARADGAELAPSWRLVALYDATAVAAVRASSSVDAPAVWTPSKGMIESCGPAKAPDGLGVFEAEAISGQLTPTLAILLERVSPSSSQPLSSTELRVFVQRPGGPESQGERDPAPQRSVPLEPAAMPRALRVEVVGGDGSRRQQQLVLTQLETELCLEHKVGRVWIGGEQDELKEAFMLREPESGRADRRAFGAMGVAVPALLGPTDACVSRAPTDWRPLQGPSEQGAGSLDLLPADVWGARLRTCTEEARAPIGGGGDTERHGDDAATLALPVRLFGDTTEAPTLVNGTTQWQTLRAEIRGAERPRDVSVRLLRWRPRARTDDSEAVDALMQYTPLFPEEAQRTDDTDAPPRSLTDLLPRVPRTYPLLRSNGDRQRDYTLLLIPDWQIVQAVRALHAAEDGLAAEKDALVPGYDDLRDGVGWLLAHPEWLAVQVIPQGVRPEEAEALAEWPEVVGPVSKGPLGLRAWGFPAGLTSGRAPVALVSASAPEWAQVSVAQRAGLSSAFLGAAGLVMVMVWLGGRRIPEIWRPQPEERVVYWPGARVEPEEGPGKSEAPRTAAPGGSQPASGEGSR